MDYYPIKLSFHIETREKNVAALIASGTVDPEITSKMFYRLSYALYLLC